MAKEKLVRDLELWCDQFDSQGEGLLLSRAAFKEVFGLMRQAATALRAVENAQSSGQATAQ